MIKSNLGPQNGLAMCVTVCVCVCVCVCLSIRRFFLNDITDHKFWEHKNHMLQKLITYLSSSECRRR